MTQNVNSQKEWMNINTEYLLPRSFLENCLVYVQRSGSTILLRTIEDQNDLTLVFQTNEEASTYLGKLETMMNDEEIVSNVPYIQTIDQ
jgi:hypothetical protein